MQQGRDPSTWVKNDAIFRTFLTKELETRCYSHVDRWHESSLTAAPRPGERCRVSNMRQRPHLNGMDAEVVSRETDDKGYLTVRIYHGADDINSEGAISGSESPPRSAKSYSKMKVHPSRLEPLHKRESGPLIPEVPPFGTTMCKKAGSAVSLAGSSVISSFISSPDRKVGSSLSPSALRTSIVSGPSRVSACSGVRSSYTPGLCRSTSTPALLQA